MPENLICKPSIGLASGVEFDLLNPTHDMIRWTDIALGLSKCARYTGQCNGLYSVARHSVIMSLHCPKEYALEALMHDAAEAFLGDCATPLKQLLPRFKMIENKILGVIYDVAGLPRASEDDPVSETIHYWDQQMFLNEWRQLMPRVDWVDHPLPENLIRIDSCNFANWQTDYSLWLNRFKDLWVSHRAFGT